MLAHLLGRGAHPDRPYAAATSAALVAAVVAAVAALGGCAPRTDKPAEPDGPQLILIGIDGAEWDVIDPLLEGGRLPALGGLIERGVGVRLRSPRPLVSPPLWTTIATGKSPLEHGITWFLTEDADGRPIPVTGARRRVPALWDVAAANGRRVAVVGWWATWPAEAVPGVMVSDRLVSHGFGIGGQRPTWGLVSPEERTTELVALVPDPVDLAPPELADLLPASEPGTAEDGVLTPLELLRAAVVEVEAHHRIAMHLLREGGYDLVCVYFEGVDTVSHVFMPLAPPPQPQVDPELARTHGATVERFYTYQDRLLGELLSVAGPDATVVVVSDHGFRSGDKRRPPPAGGWTLRQAPRDHLEEGVLVVAGPPFATRRERLAGVHLDQVAPIVLRALALPLEEPAAARVPTALFREGFLTAHPSAVVAAYPGRTPPPLPAADPGLAIEEARLRALGYLSDDAGPSATEPRVATDEGLHLAINLHLAGRLDEAAAQYEALLEDTPDDHRPALGLARVRLDQGRTAEARRALAAAVGRGAPEAEVAELEGRILSAGGAWDEAEQSLRRAVTLDPSATRAREALVDVLVARRRLDAAGDQLRELLRLDPRSAPAWRNLGVVQEAQGDPAAAAASYRQAVTVEPDYAPALTSLGLLSERRGDHAAAEALYRAALAADPDDALANTQLGVLLVNLGRPAEALEPLRAAARLRPDLAVVAVALERAEAATGG